MKVFGHYESMESLTGYGFRCEYAHVSADCQYSVWRKNDIVILRDDRTEVVQVLALPSCAGKVNAVVDMADHINTRG